jgi:acyl-[acyl carrier protein]--UDP-N-acetylglucosamine O-acyltransferase
MHVPPFVICSGINNVVALNSVGLRRRADLTDEDRRGIKEAFKITYRVGNSLKQAVNDLENIKEVGVATTRFRDFLVEVAKAEPPYNRGLCSYISRVQQRRG